MILYIDCAGGVSSDMLLSGWFGLGLPLKEFTQVLRKLGLISVRIRRRRFRHQGGGAIQVFLDGSLPATDLPPTAGHWIRWVEKSQLPSSFKRWMVQALTVLAHAEAAAHHTDWRRVEFHQIGGVDTLISLAGFCFGMIRFRIDQVYCSTVPVGLLHQDHQGRWSRSIGPATAQLLRGFPLARRPSHFEWTTPTGAALLAAFAIPRPAPVFRVVRVGRGAGHRVPPRGAYPLRLLLGEVISMRSLVGLGASSG